MRILPTQMAMDGMIEKILLRKWGTSSLNQASVEMGDAPIKNWKGSHLDFGIKRSLPTNPDVIKQVERVKYHCYSCPLGCGGICAVQGKFSSHRGAHRKDGPARRDRRPAGGRIKTRGAEDRQEKCGLCHSFRRTGAAHA
ncbi:MAG: aldehyde ferredoxin oxidoreductase C-terminal domain-containing protein [Syntrophales bacterium]|nr:aldehyde ferredoxin oxidoreductase C-terminal domain-containing protein [Syntrophales bacterium]